MPPPPRAGSSRIINPKRIDSAYRKAERKGIMRMRRRGRAEAFRRLRTIAPGLPRQRPKQKYEVGRRKRAGLAPKWTMWGLHLLRNGRNLCGEGTIADDGNCYESRLPGIG